MRKTPHTSTHPGKHVRLKLRDHSSVEGKFVEKTGNGYVVLEVAGQTNRYHVEVIDKFIVVKTVPPAR